MAAMETEDDAAALHTIAPAAAEGEGGGGAATADGGEYVAPHKRKGDANIDIGEGDAEPPTKITRSPSVAVPVRARPVMVRPPMPGRGGVVTAPGACAGGAGGSGMASSTFGVEKFVPRREMLQPLTSHAPPLDHARCEHDTMTLLVVAASMGERNSSGSYTLSLEAVVLERSPANARKSVFTAPPPAPVADDEKRAYKQQLMDAGKLSGAGLLRLCTGDGPIPSNAQPFLADDKLVKVPAPSVGDRAKFTIFVKCDPTAAEDVCGMRVVGEGAVANVWKDKRTVAFLGIAQRSGRVARDPVALLKVFGPHAKKVASADDPARAHLVWNAVVVGGPNNPAFRAGDSQYITKGKEPLGGGVAPLVAMFGAVYAVPFDEGFVGSDGGIGTPLVRVRIPYDALLRRVGPATAAQMRAMTMNVLQFHFWGGGKEGQTKVNDAYVAAITELDQDERPYGHTGLSEFGEGPGKTNAAVWTAKVDAPYFGTGPPRCMGLAVPVRGLVGVLTKDRALAAEGGLTSLAYDRFNELIIASRFPRGNKLHPMRGPFATDDDYACFACFTGEEVLQVAARYGGAEGVTARLAFGPDDVATRIEGEPEVILGAPPAAEFPTIASLSAKYGALWSPDGVSRIELTNLQERALFPPMGEDPATTAEIKAILAEVDDPKAFEHLLPADGSSLAMAIVITVPVSKR